MSADKNTGFITLELDAEEMKRRIDVRLRYHKRRSTFFRNMQNLLNTINIVGVAGALIGFVSVFDVNLMLTALDEAGIDSDSSFNIIKTINEKAALKILYPFVLALAAVSASIISIVVDYGGLAATHKSYEGDYRHLSMILNFAQRNSYEDLIFEIGRWYSSITMEAPLYMKCLLIACENEVRIARATRYDRDKVSIIRLPFWVSLTKQVFSYRDYVEKEKTVILKPEQDTT
jgi:hypothetical protein